MTGRRHDRETVTAALDLYDSGWLRSHIAKKIGVETTTVSSWVRKRDADPTLGWLPVERIVDGARHGTLSGYCTDNCLCRPCRDAYAAYERRREKARILGEGLRHVPAVGTFRRLGGLMWMGWPLAVIADRAGLPRATLTTNHGVKKVRRETHDAIKRVHAELHMTPGPSARTRMLARKHGHLPPLAWDEHNIDDPKYQPGKRRVL